MSYKKALCAALLAPLVTLAGGGLSCANAAGYGIFTQGAAALGQGNAVTAHTQSPSTVFYNPALMNKLEGTQVEFGTTAIMVSREFDSATTGQSTSDHATFFPSTFYATHKFNDSLSAGLGVYNPFGLGTRWNDDWEGKYLATRSELTTYNVNPVLSYRVLPGLSVAAGVDIVFLDATLQKKAPAAAFTALGFNGSEGDVGVKFKGDGTGVGFNVGLAYDLCKTVTFGASYRSEVKIDVDGQGSFSNQFLPGGQLKSNGKTSLTLPQQVTAALAYSGTDNLTLEAGLRWEGWSAFKELSIAIDNVPAPLSPSVTPRDWHDTWGFNLGAKYRVNDSVALLGGYVYGNSAVPDSTFDPSIPDSATHIFCLGTDLDYRPFRIGFSYAYQLYVDRTKDNAISGNLPSPPFSRANGTYQTDAHLVALSLGYRF